MVKRKSRILSPSRSLGSTLTPRRLRNRGCRSVGSPDRSITPPRGSAVRSTLSPITCTPGNKKSFLTDDTEVDMPKRQSWYKKLGDNSINMGEVLSNNRPDDNNLVFENIAEPNRVVSNEQNNMPTQDIMEDSSNSSISLGSINIPQRKLFKHKQTEPFNKFENIVSKRDSPKNIKEIDNDKTLTVNVEKKELFSKTKNKEIQNNYPQLLGNKSINTTVKKIDNTMAIEAGVAQKNLFGKRPKPNKPSAFTNFIMSESEEDTTLFQGRVMTFGKNANAKSRPRRGSSTSKRASSPASSIYSETMDVENWKLVPSSTMMGEDLAVDFTPVKQLRSTYTIEGKISEKTSPENQSRRSERNKSNNASANKNKEDSVTLKTNPVIIEEHKEKRAQRNMSKDVDDDIFYLPDQSIQRKIKENSIINKSGKKNVSNSESLRKSNRNKNKSNITDEERNANAVNNTDLNKTNISPRSQRYTRTNSKSNKSFELSLERSTRKNETNDDNAFKTKDKLSRTEIAAEKSKLVTENLKEVDEMYDNAEYVDDIQEIDKTAFKTKDKLSRTEINTEKNKFNLDCPENINEKSNQNDKLLVHDETAFKTKDKLSRTAIEKSQLVSDNVDEIHDHVEQNSEVQQNYENAFKSKEQLLKSSIIVENKKMNTDNVENYDIPENNVELDNVNIQSTLNNDNNGSEIIEQGSLVETDVVEENNESESQEDDDEQESVLKDASELEESQNYESENTEKNIDPEDDNEQDVSDNHEELDLNYEENDSIGDDNEIEIGQVQTEIKNHEANAGEDEIQNGNVSKNFEANTKEIHLMPIDNIEADSDNLRHNKSIQNDEQDASKNMEEGNVDYNDQNEESVVSDNLESEHEEEVDNESETIVEDIEEQESEQEVEIEEQEENEKNAQNELYDQEEEMEDEISQHIEDDYDYQSEPEREESNNEVEIKDQSSDVGGEASDMKSIHSASTVVGDNQAKIEERRSKNKSSSTLLNEPKRRKLNEEHNKQTKPSNAEDSNRISGAFSKNSSAVRSSTEGSEWDSHTTHIQRIVEDTIHNRKSLHTMVLTKAANKRISSKVQHYMNRETQNFGKENNNYFNENDDMHDIEGIDVTKDSIQSGKIGFGKQVTTMESYIQKIREENILQRHEIQKRVMESIVTRAPDVNHEAEVARNVKWNDNQFKKPKALVPRNMKVTEPKAMANGFKPPKLYKPPRAEWATKRLYKYLENNLNIKYRLNARIRSERFVRLLYEIIKELKKPRVPKESQVLIIKSLQKEMAKLGLVETYFQFYNFIEEFMPKEFRMKTIPDVFNGLPPPRNGIDSAILSQSIRCGKVTPSTN